MTKITCEREKTRDDELKCMTTTLTTTLLCAFTFSFDAKMMMNSYSALSSV